METYCFFIISLLVVVTYANHTYDTLMKNNTTFSQHTLCATDECINAALEILANLNRSVDPCNDFYKFACGGWIQNHPVNRSFPHVVSLTEIARKTMNQLREILEEPAKPRDTMSLIKAKHIFAQCMETGLYHYCREYRERILHIWTNSISDMTRYGICSYMKDFFPDDSEVDGGDNFSAILNRYAIGWPLNTSHLDWEDKNLTWQNISNILLENKFDNGLFSIQVLVDSKMSNSNVIVIDEPTFFSPTSNMIQPNKFFSLIEMYTSTVESVAKNFTDEDNKTVEIDNITRSALEVLTFEIELANLKDPSINHLDVDTFYVPLTIQQLQEDYDKQQPGKNAKIDWRLTIQNAFASEGITIQPSEKLIVAAYKYLTNLVPVLERTSSRTIVNYMQLTVFRKFLPYTKHSTADFIARSMMHANSTQQRSNDTRWKTCLNEVNLKSAISHEYVKKYASHINIQAIREISSDIKDAIREQIRQSTWMDEITRKASLEKLAYMKHKFIKPDWYSDEAIDRYYEGLNVSMSYLENIINILKFEKKMMLRSLRRPVDKAQWYQEPTEPGAYFAHNSNKIVVNAAILQHPLYNSSRLPCMNYGSLGFVIGHESNHGFDNLGRKYDKNGNAVEWWTQTSINGYENVTQCFIDQYDEYLIPGLESKNIHVNGQLTLGENIGDSAGLASAYYAYKSRKTQMNETELRLQGLEEYSDDQIFFMTFAQTLCANTLPTVLPHIISDVHSIHEIRVRGSLSNLREFSEAYNCSAGTPMNPEKKCALWQ